MKLKILSHLMKLEEVWNFRLKVKESRDLRFLTQKERDNPKLILLKV
jgi:uncharacterized protein YeeX (DUF496 family)